MSQIYHIENQNYNRKVFSYNKNNNLSYKT